MLAFWCLSSGPLQHLHGSDRWQECYPKNMIAGKAHALLQSSEHRTIWIESDSTPVRLCNTIVEHSNIFDIYWHLTVHLLETPNPLFLAPRLHAICVCQCDSLRTAKVDANWRCTSKILNLTEAQHLQHLLKRYNFPQVAKQTATSLGRTTNIT